MAKLKSERHHWWPECVSSYWADTEGCVHWLLPSGEVRYAPPKNFGVIGNGHHIKLSLQGDEPTPWDMSYESEFEMADSTFPELIAWLESLGRGITDTSTSLSSRFHPVFASDDEIIKMVRSIVSLAIRSPMNRESAVGVAEKLRGPLSERERNALIGINMHQDQKRAVESIGTRGKFVVVISREREFIFGDGFFHNLRSPMQNPLSPKMLVPVTPHISILYARPNSYLTEPRLFTLEIDSDEAIALNQAVQVYSKNAVFYRTEQPDILDEYRSGKHLEYRGWNNPVDCLIQKIPGVPPRNSSLDKLFGGN